MNKNKECHYINKMLKDEISADEEYEEGVNIFKNKYPEYIIKLEEAREDEYKHANIFRKMGMKFNCDIKEKEEE